MKSSELLILLTALLFTSLTANAEGGCPQGQTPTQFGPVMGCAPGGNDAAPARSAEQSAPRPAGYWEKTWGALATSSTGGALGIATGVSSREQAERVALSDCKEKGGGGCRLGISYRNQCVAMMVGIDVLLTTAASVEEATAYGFDLCKEKGDTCRVYYSGCTKPIFHLY